MAALWQRVGQCALLSLLCLATSVAPRSWADGGPDAPALTAPLSAPAWGTLDCLTRLLPIDSYSGPLNGPLALSGARGEVADAQLALFAADTPWRGVRLVFSDLTGPGGARIPHTLLRARRVGFIRTRTPFYRTRFVGLWPDPLLPEAPVDIAPRSRAFAWIDLRVPSAKPGRYAGTMTLTSDNDAPRRVPITLRVWNFTMPRASHLQTAFGAGFNGRHPLDGGAVYDDLLAHRMTPIDGAPAPRLVTPPGPGKPGQWDWMDFDRTVRARLAQGMTGFALRLPDPKPAWARAYQDHLALKGWLPLAYTYIADEPTPDQLPALNAQMEEIRRAAPRLRNLMTARGYPPQLQSVDIWCPCIVTGRDDYFQPEASRRAQAQGQESWWYVAYPTTEPSVNLWTDYPLLDDRLWPWLTWKQNVDGILYWAVTNWQNVQDPLGDAMTFLQANGDGELMYPDAQGRPLDSMRLEALRDGLQDYEVFCLLEAGAQELDTLDKRSKTTPAVSQARQGLIAQARALCAIDPRLITDYKHFNTDPHALLATRFQMNQTLERLVAALGHEPTVVDRPRRRSLARLGIPPLAPQLSR